MPRLIAGGYHYLVNVAWLLLSFLVCATKLILFIYIYIVFVCLQGFVCLQTINTYSIIIYMYIYIYHNMFKLL